MDFRVPFLLIVAVSCFTFGFAASSPSVCNHEFEQFRFDIHTKCPASMYPTPPIEVDGDSLDRLMALNHDGNAYLSVLFYASWCPFSRALRPKFDMLSSMFPQIQHLTVDHSQALPSVFSRYGIHSLPSILMVNQTSKARYHGRKDLTSLIEFYEESTGLKPVQYVAEAEVTTSIDATDGSLITWLRKGTSISEIFKRDPFLVLSLLFVCLQMAILVFPIAEPRLKALWASYVPDLNLERFGEVSQVFSRALHMVDVRRLWLKLTLVKTRNFHERAKNGSSMGLIASICLPRPNFIKPVLLILRVKKKSSPLKHPCSILSALGRDKFFNSEFVSLYASKHVNPGTAWLLFVNISLFFGFIKVEMSVLTSFLLLNNLVKKFLNLQGNFVL